MRRQRSVLIILFLKPMTVSIGVTQGVGFPAFTEKIERRFGDAGTIYFKTLPSTVLTINPTFIHLCYILNPKMNYALMSSHDKNVLLTYSFYYLLGAGKIMPLPQRCSNPNPWSPWICL